MHRTAFLILAALAGVAQAQSSSIQVFGSIDLGVVRGNGGTATSLGSNGTSKAWQIRQGRGSRLGFQGNEDIGGGTSVEFYMEHRFTPDDGVAGNPFWEGGAWVQLNQRNWGSVYLGRQYAPAFYPTVKLDPFGFDTVGQVGIKAWAGFRPESGSARTNNTIGVKTASFGGVTVQAATGLGEGTVPRQTGFNVEYLKGPLYAGMGFESKSGAATNTPSNGAGSRLWVAGGSYDFGAVKPSLLLARSTLGAGTARDDSTYWMVGLRAPMGNGILKAMYGSLDPNVTASGGPATQVNGQKQSKFAVGYDYLLSKRTRVYTDVAFAKEDQRSNNRVWDLGLRHDF